MDQPLKSRGKRLAYLVIFMVVVGVSAMGCMSLFQDRLIFFPEPLDEDQDLGWTGASEEVFLDTRDGARIHGLLFDASEQSRGVVLYFHGNAGNVASWHQVATALERYDVDVLLIDYRTYGKSRGDLSEKGLYYDGEAAYEELLRRDYDPGEIIVHGRSLGSAVATWVAYHHEVGGLVLETPFTDLVNLARELFPIGFPERLFRYRFDNMERVSEIDVPAWVVHGTKDEIVPTGHGQLVYEQLPNAWKMTIIDGGGHNNLMNFSEYERDLTAFYDVVFSDDS